MDNHKDLGLRQRGPFVFALVRGSLQFGIPVAILVTFFSNWMRWGLDFSTWDLQKLAVSGGINLLIVPIGGYFFGRALYYSQRQK